MNTTIFVVLMSIGLPISRRLVCRHPTSQQRPRSALSLPELSPTAAISSTKSRPASALSKLLPMCNVAAGELGRQ